MAKYLEFANRFKALRKEKDFTMQELTDDLKLRNGIHMTNSAVSNYEHGKRIPEVILLQQLSEYFDVSVDYLLGRSDDRKTATLKGDGSDLESIQYDSYSEIFDELERRLIKAGLLQKGEKMTTEQLKLFLMLGEDAALKVLSTKGINISALFNK